MICMYTSVRHTPEILWTMLPHYQALGVERMFVAADLESCYDRILETVVPACREYRAKLIHVEVRKAYTANRYCEVRASEIPHLCEEDDWVLIPDADEFQFWGSYENLRLTLEEADRQGVSFIRGHLIDRITRDGSLPASVVNMASMPMLCDLNRVIAKGCIDKIVAVKAKAIGSVTPGQHGIRGHKETLPIHVEVHHLKWTSGIREQLLRREADRIAAGGAWVSQTRALREYLEAHGGRIDVRDPRLNVRECPPAPGFWAGKPLKP